MTDTGRKACQNVIVFCVKLSALSSAKCLTTEDRHNKTNVHKANENTWLINCFLKVHIDVHAKVSEFQSFQTFLPGVSCSEPEEL